MHGVMANGWGGTMGILTVEGVGRGGGGHLLVACT